MLKDHRKLSEYMSDTEYECINHSKNLLTDRWNTMGLNGPRFTTVMWAEPAMWVLQPPVVKLWSEYYT
jgi:hypothetical protein